MRNATDIRHKTAGQRQERRHCSVQVRPAVPWTGSIIQHSWAETQFSDGQRSVAPGALQLDINRVVQMNFKIRHGIGVWRLDAPSHIKCCFICYNSWKINFTSTIKNCPWIPTSSDTWDTLLHFERNANDIELYARHHTNFTLLKGMEKMPRWN